MGKYAKLKHGSRELVLSSGLYCLDQEFTPPAPSPVPLISGGNMLNKYAGGKRVERSFVDRPMNVPLIVSGDSASETHHAVRQIGSFLEISMLDKSETLYFVYGESDAVPYEPKWGQHFRYYEIKDASTAIRNLYSIADVREKVVFVAIPLLVGPLALGIRQRVGSATGGILEHTWGAPDGLSRGTIVCLATTNLCTNPIFQENVTSATAYNNDWTASDASLVASKNTKKEFVLFGTNSVKLVNTDAAAQRLYYQTFTAADTSTHCFSCFVKLPDGGTVSSTQCVLRYAGNSLTTTYRQVGDGWWRLEANAAGVVASEAWGVYVKQNYSIYMDGAQAEDAANPRELCYGDQIDAAWSGDRHDSTSSRPVGRLRIAGSDSIDVAEGSVRLVWKAPRDDSNYTGTSYRLFDSGDIQMYYNGANNYFVLRDGTNSETNTVSFDKDDILIFHCVWGPGRLDLYVDGSGQTSSSFTPPAAPSYLYIGSDTAANNHPGGTFLDFVVWDVALSAAEIAADYADVYQRVTSGDGLGMRINTIPWAWFDQGDDTLDNDYAPGSSRWNYFIAGGIPGDTISLTDWRLNVNDSSFGDYEAVFLSVMPFKYGNYDDLIGDSNTVGIYKDVNLTFEINTGDSYQQVRLYHDEQLNHNYYFYIRLIDDGDDLIVRPFYGFGGLELVGEWRSISPSTATYRGYMVGPVFAPHDGIPNVEFPHANCGAVLSRTAGADDITLDYVIAVQDPLKIFLDQSMSGKSFFVNGKNVHSRYTTQDLYWYRPTVTGREQHLMPNMNNLVFNAIGDDNKTNVTTATIIYTVYVTPRWVVL